jgi:hypothetical protein
MKFVEELSFRRIGEKEKQKEEKEKKEEGKKNLFLF